MKLVKVKLEKGQFLNVEYIIGAGQGSFYLPTIEVPKAIKNAFQALNSHLCRLTCQFDNKGNLDTTSVVCRGYYYKGEGEKEVFIMTGLRSLPNGRVLIIPASPMLNLEADGGYSEMPALIEALTECRKAIVAFMGNNPGQDEIQGKLDLPGTNTKTHILKGTTGKKTGENGETEDLQEDTLTEQEKLDMEMPLTQAQVQANNARKNRGKDKAK